MKNEIHTLLIRIVAIILGIAPNIYSQKPTITWQTTIGGSNQDKVEKIITTQDGGYALIGQSYSSNFSIPVNYGDSDIVVSKISSNGTVEWSKVLGGFGQEIGYAIQELDNGDFIICGTSIGTDSDFLTNYGHTDIVLIKINQSGTLLFKKNLGGSDNDFCRDLIKTNDGNLILAASSASSNFDITENFGNSDFWIVKIDTSGTILWQKTLGGSSNETCYSILQTNDLGYIICGESMSNIVGNYGSSDAFIVKINSAGVIEWQNHFGGSAADKFRSVIQLSDSSFLAVGDTYSNDYDSIENNGMLSRDSFIVKVSALGQKEWVRCFGGNSEDDARCVTQTSDGNLVILNQIHSQSGNGDINTMYGEADFWLIKVDNFGNIIWQQNFGSSGHEEPTYMINTPDDGFILVGISYSYIDFDITQHFGGDDIWVVKLQNQENCRYNLNLSKTIYHNTAIFQAQNTIESTVKILNYNSTIQYKAGGSITLKPGFEVKTGNVWKAIIETCQN